MDLVRLERVFVPVLVLVLCGLLAFLTFWRVDNFGAKGRWSEFVESSPALIVNASARVETATSFMKDATVAGFKPEVIKQLKENTDEVEVLTRKLSPVLDFVTKIDNNDGDDMDILVATGDKSATIKIEIPADFKAQHEKLRGIRTQLEAKSDALVEQVNGLLVEFSDERKSLDTGWNDARNLLKQGVTESHEVLNLASLYILDSEQNRESLEEAVQRAQALLDGAKARPIVFADAHKQITSFEAAVQKMSDAADALYAEMVEIDNRPVIIEPEPEPVPTVEEEPVLPTEQPTSSPSPTTPPVSTPPSPTPSPGGENTGDPEEPVDPDPRTGPEPEPITEPVVLPPEG